MRVPTHRQTDKHTDGCVFITLTADAEGKNLTRKIIHVAEGIKFIWHIYKLKDLNETKNHENSWAFTYLPHSPNGHSFCPKVLLLWWIATHAQIYNKQTGPIMMTVWCHIPPFHHTLTSYDVMMSLYDVMWRCDVTLRYNMTSWCHSNETRHLTIVRNIELNYYVMKIYQVTLTFDLRPWPTIPT